MSGGKNIKKLNTRFAVNFGFDCFFNSIISGSSRQQASENAAVIKEAAGRCFNILFWLFLITPFVKDSSLAKTPATKQARVASGV